MVWIASVGKNAYLLSIIGVHTRKILKDYFPFTIKQNQFIVLLSELFENYNYPENVVIRSDNESQFIAVKVREYLGLSGVQQEFTYIEAYHGILNKEVFKRCDYQYFGKINQILKRYLKFITIEYFTAYWDEYHQ